MKSARHSSRTGEAVEVWGLGKDETLRLPRKRGGIVARVEKGTVVVTQAGDPEDHVLRTGESVTLPVAGLAIAWALTPAVLVVRGAQSPYLADVGKVAA